CRSARRTSRVRAMPAPVPRRPDVSSTSTRPPRARARPESPSLSPDRPRESCSPRDRPASARGRNSLAARPLPSANRHSPGCPPSFRRRRDTEASSHILLVVPRHPVGIDLVAIDLGRRSWLARGRNEELLSVDQHPTPLRGPDARATCLAVEYSDERRAVSTGCDLRAPGPDQDRGGARLHLELLFRRCTR